MINPFYEPFPDAVTICGRVCPVVTDFRDWLRFADLLSDDSVPAQILPVLAGNWFLCPPAVLTRAHFHALLDFYQAKALRPEREPENMPESAPHKPPVFDWKLDAPFLIADFRQFYQTDLLHISFLHWWEFLTLFRGLPQKSQSKERIYYRGCDLNQIHDRHERERILKIRRTIALPFSMSDEDIGAAMADFL
ncbi:MAG: hypothetical protein IJJ69_04055 [Oscillospiraceae bacterium]|nr:hypothetical protein [Oscillospiraceae bacterium]